jgi:NADPH-dependent curcumin reductase CurA
MVVTRAVHLIRRPVGLATALDFEVRENPVRELSDGEVRVGVRFISLDPAMRGWMNDARSYVEPVALGDVMRAYAAGIIEESRHADLAVGDAVTGILGVQTQAVCDGNQLQRVNIDQAPLERWIGGLGMPGLTAWFGLYDLGQPKTGETIVVSAASGAVGSVVGQLAKLEGLRVVGIAGGPEKCGYVVDTLGFDACVDYKADGFRRALYAEVPDGIDIYFENVGGMIFDMVLPRMNRFGRIPVCGLISAYNATEPPPGPQNLACLLVNRLRMQGFIVFDFAHRYGEAIKGLGAHHAAGRLALREDVRDGGVDAFSDALNLLYTGGNHGKLLLRV